MDFFTVILKTTLGKMMQSRERPRTAEPPQSLKQQAESERRPKGAVSRTPAQ